MQRVCLADSAWPPYITSRSPPHPSSSSTAMPVSDAILTQILTQLEALQVSQQTLQAKVRLLRTTATRIASV